jgi:cytochrome P450
LTIGTGITVPAGAVLVVPLHLVQMHNTLWGNDAGQFNPWRFLKKDIDISGLSLIWMSHTFVLDFWKFYS